MQPFVAKLHGTIKDGGTKDLLNILIKLRSPDLEAILGELDTLIGLDYANSISSSDPRCLGGFSISKAVNLRSTIEHEVIREYRTVPPETTVKLFEPLFDLVFSHVEPGAKCLPVFTTNYDPAIETFCAQEYRGYQITDGFYYDEATREHYWQEDVFDNFRFVQGKRNIVLFKLHGAVNWLLVKSANKIRRAPAMYDMLDSDEYQNVLIYPATRKIALENPYFAAYDYYQKCCERAKLCLSIGYSFRDYDALTRLRGAMAANSELRLALLSPDAQAVLKGLPLPENRKVPLSFNFGSDPQVANYLAAIEQLLPAGSRQSSFNSAAHILGKQKPQT